MRKYKYIFDIGSSKIELLVCTMYNKKPHILFSEKVAYDGYMDGAFLSPNQLYQVMGDLVNSVVKKLRRTITDVYVGVPSEFCVCVCKRIKKKFPSSKIVDDKTVLSLYEGVDEFSNSNNYVPLSYSPMQYTIDDDVKLINPAKRRTSSLSVDCSYILAKKDFVDLIDRVLLSLNIKNAEYVSIALGQAMPCIDKSNVLSPVAVVDVGHLSTSVAVIKGEGLALLSSFSLGGGHISSDLMQLLKLSYADAEALKRKIILSIQADRNDKYEICNAGRYVTAHIQFTNEIVKSRIENIANIINGVLDIDPMFKDIPIFLTGDGIANFKGILPLFSTITNRQTLDYSNRFDYTEKRHQTSCMGLCNLVYSLQENKGE